MNDTGPLAVPPLAPGRGVTAGEAKTDVVRAVRRPQVLRTKAHRGVRTLLQILATNIDVEHDVVCGLVALQSPVVQ